MLIALSWGCSDDGPSGPNPNDYDRQAMLVNWADNIIVPSYQSFADETGTLETAATNFSSNPDQQHLDSLRTQWYEAYKAWQHVASYQVGPAVDLRYRYNMNIYPVDTAGVHDNIAEGSYDLSLPAEQDRQGFPALDYLLYGLGDTDQQILNHYTSHSNADGYQAYLTDVAGRMDSLTNVVLSEWQSGYREQFVQNSGSGSNSSVDMMVNDYIMYFEKVLRSGKIGIPAGRLSGNTLPGHVEAYYRGDISKALFMEALDATQGFFNGRHVGSSGQGESLHSYLDYLEASKNGTDLQVLINARFDSARTQAEQLNDNFAEQIEQNNSAMLQVVDELQKNVVLMKVDMMQALNINVDYVDTDGD